MKKFIPRLASKSVNAAFEFGSAPAPDLGLFDQPQRSARLTADAEIAFVVLRKVADAIQLRVIPNLLPIPVREEAHLPKRFAGGETVKLELLEILARRRLFAPQTGEPDIEWFQGAEERIDFAQLAAACGSVRLRIPNADSCSGTVCLGRTLTSCSDHSFAIVSRYS